MFLPPTNKLEVEQILHTLKYNTPGYDEVPPILLKPVNQSIFTPLTHNQSLKIGIFPDKLEKAKVNPVFKSGDWHNVNNYHPISILPAFNKIFEKVIFSRLVHHLESNHLDCTPAWL